MHIEHPVLPSEPVLTLDAHLANGGGAALVAAVESTPDEIVAVVDAAGIRGRGGAGFPTARKLAAVRENLAPGAPATVVVNAAEGEPGTFKDRTLLRTNPFLVLEGALVAARAVGADRVVVAVKEAFETEARILRDAISELAAARWCDEVDVVVFGGPRQYLLGEETALLEAIDGRPPFPRLAPPYRRGVDEVVEDEADLSSGSGLAAHAELAEPTGSTNAPPTLVDNAETLAHVALALAHGPDAYRSVGTAESPGTVLCTVSGAVRTPGVVELPMGTPLSVLVDDVGGGAAEGRRVVALLPGVSNAVITAEHFDAELSYEGMAAIGSGLGSAGFVAYDDHDDMLAVAAGVSRFLYVESCGQCTACKHDGGDISTTLDALLGGSLGDAERTAAVDRVAGLLDTVADGARCSLARQHQEVVGSLMDAFPGAVTSYVDLTAASRERELVGEIVDLRAGVTLVDETGLDRQPDWSDDPVDSGETPVERWTDHRAHVATP